jgi:hypothetical protein
MDYRSSQEGIFQTIAVLDKKEYNNNIIIARQERKRVAMQQLRQRRRDALRSKTIQTTTQFKNTETTATNTETVPNVYYKYVYISDMTQAEHDLKESRPISVKTGARDQLHDASLIDSQIAFEVSKRMFYCSNDLTNRPHGSATLTSKMETDNELDRLGKPHKFIRAAEVRSTQNDMVRIAYHGSAELSEFESIGLDERALVLHVLSKGTIPDKTKRDHCTDDAVVKRINLGYGQEQGTNSTESLFVDGLCLPFLDRKRVMLISPTLREQIGDVLSLSQSLLNRFYAEATPAPFEDDRRTQLFGLPFAAKFSKQCTSKFEFVDLFLESMAGLNRHMDYSNDSDPSYGYVASYSYLFYLGDAPKKIKQVYQNRLYRMNIIMTSRRNCGRKFRLLYNR